MNSVNLCGRLTADPETRVTPAGLTNSKFTVAVDRPKAKDGTKQADFIRCVAWGKTADFINDWFKKGSAIIVIGSIRTGSYDEKNGEKVYTTEVLVDKVEFVPGAKAAEPKAKEVKSEDLTEGFTTLDDCDIPF